MARRKGQFLIKTTCGLYYDETRYAVVAGYAHCR